MKSDGIYSIASHDYAAFRTGHDGQGWWMNEDGTTYLSNDNQQVQPVIAWPVLLLVCDQQWIANFATDADAVAYLNAQLDQGMFPGNSGPVTSNSDPYDWVMPTVDVKVANQ